MARLFWTAVALLAGSLMWIPAVSAATDTPADRIDEALQNIMTLMRANRVGYATVWDGNKYIQCRRMPDRAMRCEAAGTAMQPSLKTVLTGERLNRLAALGWALDPAFGNYAQTFPANITTGRIAEQIWRTLSDAYNANTADIEIKTGWIVDIPCPPRNGPSQNLAGSVNDAPSMRATGIRACSYGVAPDTPQKVNSVAELVALHGPLATAEIQRLRINATRRVHVVFDVGIGYVQCSPETQPVGMYCEAQSAESWAPLATILTPERIARLHDVGYADPGRAPNYWKNYPLDKFSDSAIAAELLAILYDVYGYRGSSKLKVMTE